MELEKNSYGIEKKKLVQVSQQKLQRGKNTSSET